MLSPAREWLEVEFRRWWTRTGMERFIARFPVPTLARNSRVSDTVGTPTALEAFEQGVQVERERMRRILHRFHALDQMKLVQVEAMLGDAGGTLLWNEGPETPAAFSSDAEKKVGTA